MTNTPGKSTSNPKCELCNKEIMFGGGQIVNFEERKVTTLCKYCLDGKTRTVPKVDKFEHMNRHERRKLAKQTRSKKNDRIKSKVADRIREIETNEMRKVQADKE